MFHGDNLYTVDSTLAGEKHTLCVQLLDEYLTCLLIAGFFTVYFLRVGRCFCGHLIEFHVFNALIFQTCFSLTYFSDMPIVAS